MTTNGNSYKQPAFDAVAPDAIIFVESSNGMKRTISMNQITTGGTVNQSEVDLMNFVQSISISKGIDRVPGEATINLRMPKHAIEGGYFGNIRDSLSTMLEIEIYLKGRFLFDDEPQYYPVFWGIISNLAVNTSAGDLLNVTVSCQDMMRWLAVTKVNVQPAAAYPTISPPNENDGGRGTANAYTTTYVGVSTPGIIKDLLVLATSEDFFQPKNMTSDGRSLPAGSPAVLGNPDTRRQYNDQLMSFWRQKFQALESALLVYGFKQTVDNSQNPLKIKDILLDTETYGDIYGYDDNNQLRLDVSKIYPYGAAAAGVGTPPLYQGNIQKRLDIANEVKNQLHFEFFQDVDGSIVLKPPLYNMDVRESAICVIDDLDIVNFNVIEDESSVVTRLDVTGVPVNGWSSSTDPSPYYGYAIDYDLMQKYGLRDEILSTNFLTTSKDATDYAERELSRRNSLIHNGSVTIQGRPELKLGYPVYFKTRDEFYYVTGIEHSFTFGSSFDTTLSLCARRRIKTDANGNTLKNLLVQAYAAPSTESSVQGKNISYDENNPYNNMAALCDPESFQQFNVQRPDYKWSKLDDILKYQGSFKYFSNTVMPSGNASQYQQITNDEGYELIGKYPYGKDLILTEDYKILRRSTGRNSTAEIVSSMRLSSANGPSTLRFQQPVTLNQIQNVEVQLQRSKSAIVESMRPNSQ